MKSFWRDVVALSVAWDAEFDRFFDQQGVFWWDSSNAGWRNVGIVIVTSIMVGGCLSVSGRRDELGRHGRERLVLEVRERYVGFLVWVTDF